METPTTTRLDPFPLAKALRGYNWQKAGADLRAALNVALLDFPQGMAYALIAGLPVQFGIFCSAMASITGPFLASSRFVMLGPTNATAVMLLSTFLTLGFGPAESVAALPLLLILVGTFMVVGAFLRVAAITQYISRAVVAGYITAAAGLIIINQLKSVFGLHVPRAPTFAESLHNFVVGLPETHGPSVALGAGTLVVYYLFKKWLPRVPTVALTLVLMSALAALGRHLGWFEVELLTGVEATGWPLSLPEFRFDVFNELVGAALAITFLSLLESSSIAKTLAAQAGDRIDLNQQMLSMGAANFASAFGSGMTVSGSLTRSVLNFRSGARTALSSIMSGVLLIATFFLLGRFIGEIPKTVLAALVITVGLSLINRGNIRVMLKTTRSDALVFLATFIGGLLMPLDTAIYVGAGASMVLFIRKAARPEMKEMSFADTGELRESPISGDRPEIAIVHVGGDLFFASSDLFLEQMRRIVEHPRQQAVILRLRNAYHLDATVALVMMEFIRFARDHGCAVLVSGAHEEVERVYRQSGLMELLGEENFFPHNPDNPTISTRDALRQAQKLTGIESADITIFASESKD